MPNLSKTTLKEIEVDIVNLAKITVKGFTKKAVADGKAFVKQTEEQIATWLAELVAGDITQKNFESLVRGEKDLAEMKALQQVGLARAAIDTFVNGVIEIVINAALATV